MFVCCFVKVMNCTTPQHHQRISARVLSFGFRFHLLYSLATFEEGGEIKVMKALRGDGGLEARKKGQQKSNSPSHIHLMKTIREVFKLRKTERGATEW